MDTTIYLDEKHQDQLVSAFEELCTDVAESVRDIRNYVETSFDNLTVNVGENIAGALTRVTEQLEYELRGIGDEIPKAVREGVQAR